MSIVAPGKCVVKRAGVLRTIDRTKLGDFEFRGYVEVSEEELLARAGKSPAAADKAPAK